MHLKFKSQIKTKLEFLQKENGEILKGKEAANLAKEVYEQVYKNEEIDLQCVEKLEHGKKFDKKTKDILNKIFTEKEIRNAIKKLQTKHLVLLELE